LTAAGYAAAFSGSAIGVATTLDHTEALGWEEQWQAVDVALVDAADESADGDQFPGVKVVRRIRSYQSDNRVTVAVVTGHFLNDGLRHRMAEAGADFFFLRSDIRSASALQDFVLNPERYRRGVPDIADPDMARALGITSRSRVEEMVTYVDDQKIGKALDPVSPSREDPRSRRWLHHRKTIGETARIDPVNLTTGMPPYGNQSSPSLRQLRRIYRWAAKAGSADDGGNEEG
jgi:CheY-like chemotaxis protein